MAAERARELIDYVFQPNSSAPGRDCCLLDSNDILDRATFFHCVLLYCIVSYQIV